MSLERRVGDVIWHAVDGDHETADTARRVIAMVEADVRERIARDIETAKVLDLLAPMSGGLQWTPRTVADWAARIARNGVST